MSVESDARSLTDFVWNRWKELGIEPAMTWISLFQLSRFFLSEAEKREIDPQAVDFVEEVDANVGFQANKEHIADLLGGISPSPDDLVREELERLASDTEFRVIKEKQFDKLLGYERKVERLSKRLAELQEERRREQAEHAEELERLQQELAAAPTMKLLILQDFREGIAFFREGQTIETKNRAWALQKISEGKAREVTFEPEEKPVPEEPSVVPPTFPPPRERPAKWTREFETKLRREFQTGIRQRLGRPATTFMSEFQLELESLKGARGITKQEAIDHINRLVDSIVNREEKRRLPFAPRPSPKRIPPFKEFPTWQEVIEFERKQTPYAVITFEEWLRRKGIDENTVSIAELERLVKQYQSEI